MTIIVIRVIRNNPVPPAPFVLEERRLRHAASDGPPCSLLSELQSRMPRALASAGVCRRFGIRPGFDLTLYDLVLATERLEGGAMEPGLTISILLDAAGAGSLTEPDHPVSIVYAGGMTYFCFGEVPVHGHSRHPANTRVRAIELRLSLSFLESLDMLEAFRTAGPAHPLCRACRTGVWIGMAPTPAALAETAALLAGWDAGPEAGGDLLLEKGAVSALAAAMALVRHPPDAPCAGPHDSRRLEQARALIEADPGRAWTIRELARAVGVNERKLKSGFRARFGQPVHAWLTRTRLQVAHALLTERRLRVTEVSLAVGYANPSHFALLFRRRYGVAPSALLAGAAGAISPLAKPGYPGSEPEGSTDAERGTDLAAG